MTPLPLGLSQPPSEQYHVPARKTPSSASLRLQSCGVPQSHTGRGPFEARLSKWKYSNGAWQKPVDTDDVYSAAATGAATAGAATAGPACADASESK